MFLRVIALTAAASGTFAQASLQPELRCQTKTHPDIDPNEYYVGGFLYRLDNSIGSLGYAQARAGEFWCKPTKSPIVYLPALEHSARVLILETDTEPCRVSIHRVAAIVAHHETS